MPVKEFKAPAGFVSSRDAMQASKMSRQGLLYFCKRLKIAVKKIKNGKINHYFFDIAAIKKQLPNRQKRTNNYKPDVNRVIMAGKSKMVYWPGHPRANTSGLVAQHLLLVEKVIGRPVSHTEMVWHKDGNSGNNKIANLVLKTTNKLTLGKKWGQLAVEKRG